MAKNTIKRTYERLSRGEYYLLETVAEGMYPVHYILSKDIEEALNKPTHGLTREQTVELLLSLIDDGLCELHLDEKIIDSPTIDLLENHTPTKKSLFKDIIFYGLTTQGGKVWENFAKPNWNLFISPQYDFPDENSNQMVGEVVCGSEGILDRYMNSISYHHYNIESESIVRDFVQPWEATYWKTLSIGYRAKFLCTEKDENYEIPSEPEYFEKLWCNWR